MTTRSFTFDNGVTRTCLTAEASQAEGFAVGQGWRDAYRPGGPWAHGVRTSDKGFGKYLDALVENRNAWLLGFDAGLASQKANYLPEATTK